MVAESINPPLAHVYNKILSQYSSSTKPIIIPHEETHDHDQNYHESSNLELPLIDLRGLSSDDEDERDKCRAEIVRASSEWGFFQVVNHGISPKLLNEMRSEQIKLFNASFSTKSNCGLLNNSYRWGSTNPTSPDNFSWSEAFHVPLTKVSDKACYGEFQSLREVLVEYARAMEKLAKLVAEVLVLNYLGTSLELEQQEEGMMMISDSTSISCFLRLNRYPPICPLLLKNNGTSIVHGLVPHTDSDFLTILQQDQVGGLQLVKDSKWVPVKPNQHALIINIGDLFQAWSNDLYKSVEHKVVPNPEVERFSTAYFLCPNFDSLIRSCRQPSVYRDFTFGEYRKKVQEDAKLLGRKIGLPRFRH